LTEIDPLSRFILVPSFFYSLLPLSFLHLYHFLFIHLLIFLLFIIIIRGVETNETNKIYFFSFISTFFPSSLHHPNLLLPFFLPFLPILHPFNCFLLSILPPFLSFSLSSFLPRFLPFSPPYTLLPAGIPAYLLSFFLILPSFVSTFPSLLNFRVTLIHYLYVFL